MSIPECDLHILKQAQALDRDLDAHDTVPAVARYLLGVLLMSTINDEVAHQIHAIIRKHFPRVVTETVSVVKSRVS